jgi:hypothetical protein
MYTSVDFTNKIAGGGGLVHQFGVLAMTLKNKLLLLLI